jgi:hypothetical protein
MHERTQEHRIRRLARRQGYTVRKSRAGLSGDNLGEYALVNSYYNIVVLGWRFDATLEQIEAFLRE